MATVTRSSMKEREFPFTFSEWVKRRRKELDLTQAELAERSGCSVFALRKIEAGERRPSKQLAALLAQSLDIPAPDQPTFVKVARGELNLERLHPPSARPAAPLEAPLPAPAPVSLPFQPAPLIGRESELATLGKLLADPHCRLLTLTGLGGIGKTRLAVELAAREQARFGGGVYYVSLASLNSPEFIVPALAEVLGLSFSGALAPQEQLLRHLAARTHLPLLLVLDNLEHLLVPAKSLETKPDITLLVADLLQNLPNIKILVTSRERINILGEWTFELHGLPVPANDQVDQLESFSAPALFLKRARQVKADFEVLPEERPLLVKLCQLLEGMPLAIELAAAWAGMLSMQEIAQELISDLNFLKTSFRDIPERHRSLRATFDHSWRLLSVEEQEGLCRIAVFRGGFQRQAAERVAGTSLMTLKSLHSKAFLIRREDGRYDLHEIVRQYALSRLEDDPQNKTIRNQHCRFFLEYAREQEKAINGADHSAAIQAFLSELDNLRTAMAWGLENHQIECSLQIAMAMGQFWITQGYWREGLDWLERGLADPQPLPDPVRAKALTCAGWLSRYLGDFHKAIAMLEESLALWRRSEDRTGIALTLCNLGAAVLRQGEVLKATGFLAESFRLSQKKEDRYGMYFSLEILGHAASRQGNSQKSIELYNQALDLARQANDENEVMKLMGSIGYEYILLGDYDQAEDWFSLTEPICQRLRNRMVETFLSSHRGLIAMKKGDYSLAFDLLSDSIIALQELGDKEETIFWLEPLAYIASEIGFPDRAARLLGASESLRKEIGVIRSQSIQADYDAYTAGVLEQLGKAAFEIAWMEGSKMNYEEAIAYAVTSARTWSVDIEKPSNHSASKVA